MSGRVNNVKLCFVPACLNSAKNSPKKWFVPVPKEELRRASWFKAVNRDFTPGNNSLTPLFCCSDHFDETEDTEPCTDPSGQPRTRLKHTVVPRLTKTVKVKSLTPETPIKSHIVSLSSKVDSAAVTRGVTTKGKEKYSLSEINQLSELKNLIPALENSGNVSYGVIIKEAENFVKQMILRTSKRETSITFAKKKNTALEDKIKTLEKLKSDAESGMVLTKDMIKQFDVEDKESPRRVAVRGRKRSFGKRRSLP